MVSGLLESHQIGIFLSRLRTNIRVGVRLLHPMGLTKTFELALGQEDAIIATITHNMTRTISRPSSSWPSNISYVPKPVNQLPSLPTGVKRLSWTEQKERCFAMRFISLVIDAKSHNYLSWKAKVDVEDFEYETVVGGVPAPPTSEISLHALMVSTRPETMRISGTLKNQPITILVDSGSTHNFILPSIAKQCGYSIQRDKSLRVIVAGGGFLNSLGNY
ncbi:unnamed protein product [Camellia sinensis]